MKRIHFKKLTNKNQLHIICVLAILGIVLIGWITKRTVQYLLREQAQITQAFDDTQVNLYESSVTCVGELGMQTFTYEEKENLVRKIATDMGLTSVNKLKKREKDNVTELFFDHNGKSAHSLIKFVTVRSDVTKEVEAMNQYVIVQLTLYDQMDHIVDYKKILLDTFHSLGISNQETELQFTCRQNGKLTMKEKNRLSNQLVKNLRGKVQFGHREEDLYTIYAYSGILNDYIETENTKVNIQVAMNYDEEKDETVVFVGSPILNGTY